MDDKLWWMMRNDHESLEPLETPVPKVPRGTTNTAPSADVIEVGPRTQGIYLTKAGLLVQVPLRIPHSSGLKNRSKNGTHPDLDYAFVNVTILINSPLKKCTSCLFMFKNFSWIFLVLEFWHRKFHPDHPDMTFLLSGGKSQLASGGESSSDHCRDALQSSAAQPQLNQFFSKLQKRGSIIWGRRVFKVLRLC